ncbi:MAG: hypothetical protein ABEJ58_04510 [Halodesulfurarchaeum sp.]
MHEVVSEAEATHSSTVAIAFIALSLALFLVGVAFAAGVFLGASQTVLGLVLTAGFAMVPVVLVLYHRLTRPHRVLLEYDEDLW